MDVSEMRKLVKDLDLTFQPRIAPRYKTWLPLATQQLRLRSLIQIIGHKLQTTPKSCWFYYTLHRTSMSSPFYTSELNDKVSPKWHSLEVPTVYATGYSLTNEVILRLWKRTDTNDTSADVTVFTWGISFTGLAYIGSKLPNNLENVLREKSIIFHFHGGFFTPVYCFLTPPDMKKHLSFSVPASEVKDSYTVNKLTSLRSKMQALKQQTESVQALRIKIASGEDIQQTPKYPQSFLNKLFQPRKVNKEKKAEILNVKKELEVARFRTRLLEQERSRKMGELRVLNQLHHSIMDKNQDCDSELMEKYRVLSRDIERLQDWRQGHLDKREAFLQTTCKLAFRRCELISELRSIYPIKEELDGKYTITNVHLPNSEDLDSSNDTQIAVALGYVAHTTQMIATFLNVPTRYPIIHYGSRSKIVDHLVENISDSDRQFPLFARSKDKLHFRYAVYLLNKNIAQIRWYCGLPTTDLRPTLSNLTGLINLKPRPSKLDNSARTLSASSLEMEMNNDRGCMHQNVLTTQRMIFEKQHPARSMLQLKIIKSGLGSSLDQGLNRPVESCLSSQLKRISKSQEIDNTLELHKDEISNSSSETLNSTFHNGESRADDKFIQIPKETIDNDIEITIPTSVSKSRHADDLDSSGSAKNRSSNSISSCEMALSFCQAEGDSITIGNSSKETIGGNFTNEILQKSDSVDSAVPKKGESTPIKKTLGCSTSNICDIERLLTNEQNQPGDVGREAAERQRTDSDASYSEEYRLTLLPTFQDQYKSETRPVEDLQFLSKECSEVNENNLCSEKNLKEENPSTCTNDKQSDDKQCDFRTSSEYMDLIKRSSENVYARTEALANKKSSFKVMRPRL
ncbi:UV radiation resistance-associated gene protein isoform X2 [Prorops nasuta]|uniref:UV radiation resistance-associated gene protein isoform X2 n=1 Tax=Prorops nasuta TaxID=863751 RepID=UPI0034D017BD